MATYTYKALTKRGMVVRNRVEAPTKQALIKLLKSNEMLPISVTKIPYGGAKVKRKQKRKRMMGNNNPHTQKGSK